MRRQEYDIIEVIVDTDGSLSIEGKGIKGKRCTDVTKFLTDAFAAKEVKKTSEYYQNEPIKRLLKV